MISHSTQALRGILRGIGFSDEKIADFEEEFTKGAFPEQNGLHVVGGELRAFTALKNDFFVNELALVVLPEDLLDGSAKFKLDDERLARVGFEMCCSTVYGSYASFTAPALDFEATAPEMTCERHGLSLSDVHIDGTGMSVCGRNLTDLDFGCGALRGAWGDLHEFDFSCNPALRLSQILAFLHENAFDWRCALCHGITVDCTPDPRCEIHEYEQVAELSELALEMTVRHRTYPKCVILHVAAQNLQNLNLQEFPALAALKISFEREFSIPEVLAHQLSTQTVILEINGTLCVQPVFFQTNGQILVDPSHLESIRDTVFTRLGRGKLVFQHEVTKTTLPNGKIVINGAENNSALCFFEGPISAFAARGNQLESNFATIYHSVGSDIYEILVRTKPVRAGDRIVISETWVDQARDSAENAAICKCMIDECVPETPQKLQTSSFDSEPSSLAALCRCSAEQYISSELRVYSKHEAVLLLISGLLQRVAAWNGHEMLVSIRAGACEAFKIERRSNSNQLSLTAFQTDCEAARLWVNANFREEDARLLASTDMTTFSLLDLGQ